MTALAQAILIAATLASTTVLAAMPPFVCPGTPCPECNYAGIPAISFAALFGQPCDAVNNPCNGSLLCCNVKDVGYVCTKPVATAPHSGFCPGKSASSPGARVRQCPEDMGLHCTYDSECDSEQKKCCFDYECCGSTPGCQKRKCVKSVSGG